MKKRIGLLLLFIVIAALVGFGVYSWNYYSKYIDVDTIYPGVTIQGMDVGGLSVEEAQQKVDDYVDALSEKTVTLQVEDKEKSFALRQAGLTCENPDAAKQAEALGREGNIIKGSCRYRPLPPEERISPLTFPWMRTRQSRS